MNADMFPRSYLRWMKDKTLHTVLLMVGLLSLIAGLSLYASGRVKSLMDVFYPLFFGVLFLGEYVRQKYYKTTEDE